MRKEFSTLADAVLCPEIYTDRYVMVVSERTVIRVGTTLRGTLLNIQGILSRSYQQTKKIVYRDVFEFYQNTYNTYKFFLLISLQKIPVVLSMASMAVVKMLS